VPGPSIETVSEALKRADRERRNEESHCFAVDGWCSDLRCFAKQGTDRAKLPCPVEARPLTPVPDVVPPWRRR
jgi:hypothetical protein